MTIHNFLFSMHCFTDGEKTASVHREETNKFIVGYMLTELGFNAEFNYVLPNAVLVSSRYSNCRDETLVIAQISACDIGRLKQITDVDRARIENRLSDQQKLVDQLFLKRRSENSATDLEYSIFSLRAVRAIFMILGDENPQGWVNANINQTDLLSALTQYLFEGASKADLLTALTVSIKRDLGENPVL